METVTLLASFVLSSANDTAYSRGETEIMAMPAATPSWTLEELHRLPDDGNKYELVRGQLFVTPAPAPRHEVTLARLSSILEPYVAAQGLGRVYHPRSVLRFEDSEVEPDLMVRAEPPTPDTPWEAWPIPLLVVEALSPTTRRRDFGDKRDLYIDAAVADYWIIDADSRSIHIASSGKTIARVTEEMHWHPANATQPLTFAIDALFR